MTDKQSQQELQALSIAGSSTNISPPDGKNENVAKSTATNSTVTTTSIASPKSSSPAAVAVTTTSGTPPSLKATTRAVSDSSSIYNKTSITTTLPKKTTGIPSPTKSAPTAAASYANPTTKIKTNTTGAHPRVHPIHHPYPHHHYYAYHHHLAAVNASANAVDHKKTGKSNPATYCSAQHKSESAVGTKPEGVGSTKVSSGPLAMYPPPPPGVPPHHHHAYHAWAAYRYAQQHPQYHGGIPPPGHHGWNPEAYAASHQSYVMAAKAAAGKATKESDREGAAKGKTGAGAVVAPTPVGSGNILLHPPHHHHYPHSGSPSAGPYRYSDPTLRRDALSRLSTPDSKKNGNAPSSMTSNTSPSTPVSTSSHSPPDPATLHMLEMEARAEGATSPSQIEDFHREEVTTMGCTCKKTKCLKLYCQCFAVKIYCGNNCRCLSCSNNPVHEIERQDAIRGILSRNPSAFETKFQKLQRNSAANLSKSTSDGGVGTSGRVFIGGGTTTNSTVPRGVRGRGLFTADIPHARTISHKLGCKCRKSACMKKYCECYAGNVKCSANCRCVGCKNMPDDANSIKGDVPPAASAVNRTVVTTNFARTPTKSSSIMTTPTKKQPSWMMDAAHNLAFLKHGSTEKTQKHVSRVPSEGEPSKLLASSSKESLIRNGGTINHNKSGRTESISINGSMNIPTPSTAERAAVNALQSSEKTAVNALLMAAMAMTEMSGQEPSNISNNNKNVRNQPTSKTHDTDTNTSHKAETVETYSPPLHNYQNKINHYGNGENNSSPEATNRADDQFETPQRNLLKKFISPKRKANETNTSEMNSAAKTDSSDHVDSCKTASGESFTEYESEDDESPKRDRELAGDGTYTPSISQKIKRSRLGSFKKGVRHPDRNSEEMQKTKGVVPMVLSTPAKSPGNEDKVTDLTPVSARCIDFKKMHVNDSDHVVNI